MLRLTTKLTQRAKLTNFQQFNFSTTSKSIINTSLTSTKSTPSPVILQQKRLFTNQLQSKQHQNHHSTTFTQSTSKSSQHKSTSFQFTQNHRHLPYIAPPAILFSSFPFQQPPPDQSPTVLSRDLDIEYYANEQHYKEEIKYVDTTDIVVNIRQIQRIIMKDAFLCKKYCRYIIETVEDAKRIIEQAEKRLGTMIEVTVHEPTNEIYRNYILKLDAERDALDGYLNLALLSVMPVASITKHFKTIIDEVHNDGGLGAEFLLVQEQFDIVHEQLNQIQELSLKADSIVEITEKCVQDFLREMTDEIESIELNALPKELSHYRGQQPLSSTYFDENGRSTNKYVPEVELERVFNEISDPKERDRELRRIANENRRKEHLKDMDVAMQYRNHMKGPSKSKPFEAIDADDDYDYVKTYDDDGTVLSVKPVRKVK